MKRQNLLSIFFLAFLAINIQAQVDMIMFSFNRPLQLYAALESATTRIKNLSNIYVLYRTSNQAYEAAYKEIQENFPHITFVKEENKNDFKPLLLKCFYASASPYITFSVDDDIITDPFDINDCVDGLKKTGAYGFYLWLGKNISQDAFIPNKPLQIPPLTKITDSIYQFHFQDHWNYPNTVVTTIYSKKDIETFITNASYNTPNTLESVWSQIPPRNYFGLCFQKSMSTMVALNKVQTDWYVPHFNSYSIEFLFDQWNKGLKMDISPFLNLPYSVTHLDATPVFIPRKSFVKKTIPSTKNKTCNCKTQNNSLSQNDLNELIHWYPQFHN